MKKTGFGTPNQTPLTPALGIGNMIFVSGQVPRDSDGNIPESIEDQTRMVMDKIGVLLREAGADFDDIVKSTVFLTDKSKFAGMNSAYAEYFSSLPPTRSTIQCGLMIPILVEIECLAIINK